LAEAWWRAGSPTKGPWVRVFVKAGPHSLPPFEDRRPPKPSVLIAVHESPTTPLVLPGAPIKWERPGKTRGRHLSPRFGEGARSVQNV